MKFLIAQMRNRRSMTAIISLDVLGQKFLEPCFFFIIINLIRKKEIMVVTVANKVNRWKTGPVWRPYPSVFV